MSEIDRRWIGAHVAGGIIAILLWLAVQALNQWLANGSAGTLFATTEVYLAVYIVHAAIGDAFLGWLTGAALRLIVPALPWWRWIAIYVMVGLVISLGFIFIADHPGNEHINWYGLRWGEIVFLLMFVAVAAGLAGAIAGALGAFVLRSAADGTEGWITRSALASAVNYPVFAAILLMFPPGETVTLEAVWIAAMFAGVVAGAFVMLPAVRRLRPRTV